MAAALALTMGGQQVDVQQSKAALPEAPSQQAQQQQQIPDAPKPQSPVLGTIGPITPGKGTTPTSNGESVSNPGPVDPDQPEIGSSLPGTKRMADEEQVAAPEVPANSQEFFKDPNAYTLVTRVNSVEVPFTVKDKQGRLVPGLTWRDVHVYENNVRQRMTVFTVDPYPLSVAMVIDNSLDFHTMATVNNSLGALQAAFTPYDEVAVFTYSNGPKLLTDLSGAQSNRITAAIERSKGTGRDTVYYQPGEALGSHGIILNNGADINQDLNQGHQAGSPGGIHDSQVQREVHTLNDAIFAAAQVVAKAAKGRRRIVYVVSDGKEYGSNIKQKELIKYLQTNKIEVVATLVGDSSLKGMGFIDTLDLPLMMRDNVLPVFTKATGGEFYAHYRTKGIEESFAKITEEARVQYTAWYNSREPMIDGKYRQLEVRVLRPNLQVIAKKGYYPSVSDQRPQAKPPTTAPAAPPTQQ